MSDDFDLNALAKKARDKRKESMATEEINIGEAMDKLGQATKVVAEKAKQSASKAVEMGKQAAQSEHAEGATKAVGKAFNTVKVAKGRLGGAWWSTALALVIGAVLVTQRLTATPPTEDQVFKAVALSQNVNNEWPWWTGNNRGQEGVFSKVDVAPLDAAHPYLDVSNVQVGSCRRAFGGGRGLPDGVVGSAWTCALTFDATVDGQKKTGLTESVRIIRASSEKDEHGASGALCSDCSMSWAFAMPSSATELSTSGGAIVHISPIKQEETQP